MKKKVSILIIFITLFFILGHLVYQNYILDKEVKEMQKDRNTIKVSENEKLLQNKLDEFYRKEEIEKEAKTKITNLVSEFVKKTYQAPATEYGQIPYLRDYLTDSGMRSLLTSIYPDRYQDVSEGVIDKIRKYPLETIQENSILITDDTAYISLGEDKTSGNILCIYNVKFSDEKTFGLRLFLEVEVIVENTQWKIDKIEQLQQL